MRRFLKHAAHNHRARVSGFEFEQPASPGTSAFQSLLSQPTNIEQSVGKRGGWTLVAFFDRDDQLIVQPGRNLLTAERQATNQTKQNTKNKGNKTHEPSKSTLQAGRQELNSRWN